MSAIMQRSFPPAPLCEMVASMAMCGTAPKAFDTFSHAIHFLDLPFLAFSSIRLSVCTCSKAPSAGRNPFWQGLIAS